MFFELLKNLFSSSFSKRGSVSRETEDKIRADWQQLEVLLKGGAPSQLRQALITADKALDNALRDVVSGTTMGERLKVANTKFDKVLYNKIWAAHKVRNALVHESGYEPPHYVVTGAIRDLKRGLEALGVLV